MTEHSECAADEDGRKCHRVAVMEHPIALCQAHRIEIAIAVVPELLRDQLMCALRGAAEPPAVRADLVAQARAVEIDSMLGGVHDSLVYFIANGGRIKIGYTTNLKSRLSSLALRRDSVLLALEGGPELERALHAHFTAYRSGNTEWFDLAPEVFRYIAAPHPSRGASPAADTADELTLKARADFPKGASVRELRSRYGIGQARAQRIRDALAA